MKNEKIKRPRLITFLSVLLIVQAPFVLFIALNLLTDRWTFLLSWPVFWVDVQEAFSMVRHTPGLVEGEEILFYNVIAFGLLSGAAGFALFSGLTFHSGSVFSWLFSLIAQMITLLTGIGLYFIYRPTQAYWLIAVSILLVLYLNYGEVRQWFLRSEVPTEEAVDVRI